MTKFEIETRRRLYVFIEKKKQQLTQQNVRQQHMHMMHSVQQHRHDMFTVPLTVLSHHSITSMMHILSYSCSYLHSDKQFVSKNFVIVLINPIICLEANGNVNHLSSVDHNDLPCLQMV